MIKQPAWNKYNEVSKTKEILKTAEINKYSDSSNFWNYLFGEYEIYPSVKCEVSHEKRKIDLSTEEREINLDAQQRNIKLSHE